MVDGRRARGDRTRDRVLAPAVPFATVHGLDGVTYGELAKASGVAKATIAALFPTKADLQAAIAARARGVLRERVLFPVAAVEPGLARLEALGRIWLDYLTDPELEGGCFFAAALAELDARPGPLRDELRTELEGWLAGIAAMVRDGQARGEVDPAVDPEDRAFAFFALGITANTAIQLGVEARPAERARRAWAAQIEEIRSRDR